MLAAQQTDRPDTSLRNLREVVRLARRAYVERVEPGQLLPAAYSGLTDALDPFSMFVPKSQIKPLEEALRIGGKQSGLLLLKEPGVVYVAAIVPRAR